MNHYVSEHGTGVPVIFIHGFAGNSRTWLPQVRMFQKKFRVLLYDLRGHGKTGGSKVESYDAELYADDLAAMMKSKGITSAHICSLSMGALVAQAFAGKYPQMVRTLTLAGGFYRLPWYFRAVIAPLNRTLTRILPPSMIVRIGSKVLMPRRREQVGRQAFIKASRDLCPREFEKIISFLTSADGGSLCRKLKVPTHLISGEADYWFISQVKKMKEWIHGAKIHLLKGCAHVVTIERFAEFNTLYLEILERFEQQHQQPKALTT
ncbi:pimeloyl-ACP methyl ester carboxylesterase [Tumebacillus sp. BK434]|uniref:alpha/beta fold hydrolase n=1 Tax=Tumebacillus sp. BK434 TaxID=2512169 RepID=UPI001047591E|nr:alpha/beta hydrolase [Tumebacillus sp. BK434]TCP55437.1 pimeloyl-ACP methyl ester carboxylesterase [Tumebacillus sp. BK434]